MKENEAGFSEGMAIFPEFSHGLSQTHVVIYQIKIKGTYI